MTVISLDDIQHCGGTQTRSNGKLLIVPCFLLSNLGLYLSISLLLVSLIMQTKHKCGDCQLNPTTAGLPAICPHSYRYRCNNFQTVWWTYKPGGLWQKQSSWNLVTERVTPIEALYTITHPQHPRFDLVFHCVFCQNVLEQATFLHCITYMKSLICTVKNSSKHKST